MACYENCTKELVLNHYKETGIFSGDTIINNDLSDIECPGIRFHNVSIKQSYLDRALLKEMICQNVIFEQSNSNSIQAMNSQIQESKFLYCHSIKADFSHATIHKTRFENCIAHSIRLTGTRITDSVFYTCQMYKAKFDKSILIKVAFQAGEKDDLSTLQKATFTNSMLIDCSFSFINLIGAEFGHSVFIGCDFTGTNLDETDLLYSSFINCIIDEQGIIPGKLTNSQERSNIFK